MDPPGIENQDIPIGVAIYTNDGQRLGTIAGIDSGYVRVEAEGSNRYWIGVQAIQAVDPDRVILIFPAAQLGEYRKEISPP